MQSQHKRINYLLTEQREVNKCLSVWLFFPEIQTEISRTGENKDKVSGPDTEIYGPPVWIRDLRDTAREPIRMQDNNMPYNNIPYSLAVL